MPLFQSLIVSLVALPLRLPCREWSWPIICETRFRAHQEYYIYINLLKRKFTVSKQADGRNK